MIRLTDFLKLKYNGESNGRILDIHMAIMPLIGLLFNYRVFLCPYSKEFRRL